MVAICNGTDALLSPTPQAHRGKRWTNFLLSLLTLFVLTCSIALTRGMQVVADGSGACLCTTSEMCVESVLFLRMSERTPRYRNQQRYRTAICFLCGPLAKQLVPNHQHYFIFER